ncbi:hypothetical protein [Peribacillus sp. TH14]|uniref:hypothetical protein n=1 Tax=Peribacillus sp. TH14 TaxID=2798481 RepID=UPI001912FB4A|nr:hypothetical protein [Peribacillus sp. TH14]MBK5500850.1 hypothetical protein [Peribacillus sp. TH14]
MNKAILQGLSAGIIFSTAIFAGFYYGTGANAGHAPTTEEAKELLVKKGFIVSSPTDEGEIAGKPSKSEDKEKQKKQDVSPIQETKEKEVSKKEDTIVPYTLKVKSNMTTTEITQILAKEKIIDDAAGFEAYMNEHDFSKNVQIGVFVVTNNMTYRQLAHTLTH